MKTRHKVALVPVIGIIGAALCYEAGYSAKQIAILLGIWIGVGGAVTANLILGHHIQPSRLVSTVTCGILSLLVGGAAARKTYLAGEGLDAIAWMFLLFGGGAAFFLFGALLGKNYARYERCDACNDDPADIVLPDATDVANWPTQGANGRSLETIRWMEHR